MSKDNFESCYREEIQVDSLDKILGEIPGHRKSILKVFNMAILNYLQGELTIILSQCESPIEELLCGALIIKAIDNLGEVEVRPPFEWFHYGQAPDKLIIKLQHKMGKYRVDFNIEYQSWSGTGEYKNSILIVECDGHDFHEKTKEQAKKDKERDRDLQSLGFPIFHFTGSEIWKNPFQCADSILNFLTTQGN